MAKSPPAPPSAIRSRSGSTSCRVLASSRDIHDREGGFMAQLLIDGRWVDGASTEHLVDKYRGAVFGEMAVASAEQVRLAVTGTHAAVQSSKLKPYDRYRILSK